MKSMSTMLIGAVLVLGVPATYASNLERSRADQMCRATRALTTAQQADGWAWAKGDASAALNVSGVVASALAAAPGECGAAEAVRQYADSVVARHERGEFVLDPDVGALALAADLAKNERYREIAHEAFQRRYQFATGEEIVECSWRCGSDPFTLSVAAKQRSRRAR